MNAFELAELRITLDRIGMRDWTIQRKPPDEFDWLVQVVSSGASLLKSASFYLENRNTGKIVDFHMAMNFLTGETCLWQARIRDGKAVGFQLWLEHTDLEGMLAILSVELRKAGRLT